MDDLVPRPKKRLRDWCGLVVEITVALHNSYVAVPARTEAVVTDWRKGLSLRFAPCSHCGVAPLISKVDPREVRVIRRVADADVAYHADPVFLVNAAWPKGADHGA